MKKYSVTYLDTYKFFLICLIAFTLLIFTSGCPRQYRKTFRTSMQHEWWISNNAKSLYAIPYVDAGNTKEAYEGKLFSVRLELGCEHWNPAVVDSMLNSIVIDSVILSSVEDNSLRLVLSTKADSVFCLSGLPPCTNLIRRVSFGRTEIKNSLDELSFTVHIKLIEELVTTKRTRSWRMKRSEGTWREASF